MTQPQKKEISINAFYANTPGQSWVGLWSWPGSKASRYTDLEYWTEVAAIAERGLFDSIFFADTNGVHDVYQGAPRAAIERAAMFPVNDPFMVVPAMALVTKNLSFGVTANLSYEQPFALARRFSTLDHLTKGRISWNVVTGFQDSAARSMGLEKQRDHDDRYDLADEYMELVYKLWEESWEDGAVVRDAATRTYARGDLVHEVTHEGASMKMRGIHMCEPSPQRTPVLFQAGGSQRGRVFAAKHAECIFLSGLPRQQTADRVREIRDRAAAEGRDPTKIKFILMATVVTAPTEAEARDKYESLSRHVDAEGMLALYSGLSGMDLSREVERTLNGKPASNGINSLIEHLVTEDKSLERLRDIARFGGQVGRACFMVGSPVQVADEMESWMEETGVDGFNLQRAGEPQHLIDVVDLIVPELQNRGVYKTAYQPGSFRQKLFGAGDGIHMSHPAAKAKRA